MESEQPDAHTDYEDDSYEPEEGFSLARAFSDGEAYDEADHRDRGRRSRSRAAVIVAATVFAGLLAGAGYGYHQLTSGSGGSSHTAASSATATTPPTSDQAATTAKAFLAAWAGGDLESAGNLTDQPYTATDALTRLKQNLNFSSLTLAPGAVADPGPTSPGERQVGFHVTVNFASGSGTSWQYDGHLGVRTGKDGKPLVRWDPTVIHPSLGPGQSIALRPTAANAAPPPVDRNGRQLDPALYPSLAPLLNAVQTATAPSGSTASAGGQAVQVLNSAGAEVQQLFVVSAAANIAPLRLTVDADLQKAAEQAVATQHGPASVVAVEPSTGNILAVAYSQTGGFNSAFQGGQSPGSTMKVITAAALLEANDTPNTPVPCPEYAYSPRRWPNAESGSSLNNTLAEDFAQSCNTAFIGEAQKKMLPIDRIATVAQQQFGLNSKWSLAPGIGAAGATVPVPKDSDDAASEDIGQSSIRANALAMASVAATVQNGTFHQPVLVAGYPQLPAAQQLPPLVAQELRDMMRRTASSGTASNVMAGLSGQVGAKTGTAQVDTGADNSWFIGYRDNLAVAAEVEGGGAGNGAAGQATAAVLTVGNR